MKVIPRSARAEMAGEMADGTLKILLKSAPEGGRANYELCGFLAGALRRCAAGSEDRDGRYGTAEAGADFDAVVLRARVKSSAS